MVFVVGFIVQLNSERAYWFYSPDWFTTQIGETLGVAAFYGFAAAAALWILGRIPYRGTHQLILAGALFAWTVEGVIVYVLHEAGPLDPFFPAMFAGWHGLLSFVFLAFAVRRWLIAGATRTLGIAATVYGVWWGLWATTSRLPDSDQALAATDGVAATPIAEFAVVTALVTCAVAVGHLLLDRVWPAGWIPGRISGWIILGSTGLYAAASGLAIPWAPFRWAALVAIPVSGLILTRRGSARSNVYSALRGRILPRSLLALAPIGIGASVVYALAAPLPQDVVELLFFSMVLVQMLAGGSALIWAMVRSLRTPASTDLDSLGA